ncbi:MAG: hypothetical protein ACI9EF_001967 [Pseudohongiellaceae bacterium]
MGFGQGAIDLAIRAIRTHPEAPYAQWNVGGKFIIHQLADDKFQRERLRCYEAYNEVTPDDAALWNEWAWGILSVPDVTADEQAQARFYALHSMEVDVETMAAWNTVAVASWMLGEYETTVEASKRSIELGHGGFATDHALVALACAALGRVTEGRAALKRIDEGQPAADALELSIVAEAQRLFEP